MTGELSFLAVVGAVVIGLFALCLIVALLATATNIICGMRGAVRMRRVIKKPIQFADWWPIIKQGFRCWYGARFNGDAGEYWQLGAMKVPLDIRDPIYRERFYGA